MVFVGLVVIKLVAGTWDDPPYDSSTIEAGGREPLVRGGGGGGGVAPVLHDLQTGAKLELRGGTPRDGYEEIPLSGGGSS